MNATVLYLKEVLFYIFYVLYLCYKTCVDNNPTKYLIYYKKRL